MSTGEIIKFLILRTLGNFFLLFAIFGVVATFGPSLFYELEFRIAQARGITYTVRDPQAEQKVSPFGQLLERQGVDRSQQAPGFAQVLAGPTEQILLPKDTEFSVILPRIGASAQVFPNIDANNEKEFLKVLQTGVAHAKGSVFPGIKGNTYLFAHSTDNFWDVGRYNAIFYLLKDLQVGDDVVIFFENVRHNYTVTETKIVDPSDVSALTKSQEGQDEQLVMQTCWPPGTTWKRLLVFAAPKR